MKLHLHIDRLVVPAGAAADPERLAAAVEAALGDMLHGTDAADLLGPGLAGGGARPSAPPVTTGAALPRAIAGAVLTTLKGPTR